MIQAYIAGPLINEQYRDLTFYHAISDVCRELSIQPFLPHVATEPTDVHADPHIVFQQNVAALTQSDILIAEISEPSHGVGCELMQAFFQGKAIICLADHSKKLSRMITGNPRVQAIIQYKNKKDCLRQLKLYLRSVKL